MPILTKDEFKARVGEKELLQICGNGTQSARDIDEPRLDAELAAADELASGYIQARFPNAVLFPPEALKGWVSDIARWRLRSRGNIGVDMTDVVQRYYDEAIKHLKLVRDGDFTLFTGAPMGNGSGSGTGAAGGAGALPTPPLSGAALNYRVDGYTPSSKTSEMLRGF